MADAPSVCPDMTDSTRLRPRPETILPGRLRLRRQQPGDVDPLYPIYCDPATHLHHPARRLSSIDAAGHTMARWQRHWQDHGSGQWVVCLVDAGDRVIGFGRVTYRCCGGVDKHDPGCRLTPTASGHGYATEFASCVLGCAFLHSGAAEVLALIRLANRGSIRVAGKVGMQRAPELDDQVGDAVRLVFRKTARAVVVHDGRLP